MLYWHFPAQLHFPTARGFFKGEIMSAWLIEKHGRRKIWFLTIKNKDLTWSINIEDAIRFSRLVDASKLAEVLTDEYTISEHVLH